MHAFQLRHARDLGLPPLGRLSDIRRERGHLDALIQPAAAKLVRCWLKHAHGLTVRGIEHLPAEPPYVLVANHTSHLDTLVLLDALPDADRPMAYPVAAHDTFFTTPARALAATKLVNALPIRRHTADRQALKALRQRVTEDRSVLIVYPEGTRGDGGAIQSFLPGIGMLVAGTNVPVVPCRLRGCERALPKGSWFPRPTPLSLGVGKPLRFADTAHNRSGWRGIAEQLHSAVLDL